MSDLLERLAGAITYIHSGQTDSAMSLLRYCASLDPTQCDIWVTWAAATGEVDSETLTQMAGTKRTFDMCFAQLDNSYAETVVARQPHFPLGFAGLRASVTSVAGIELAQAASWVLAGDYARADAALSSMVSGEGRAVRAWLYHRAGRFTDVLETAAALLSLGHDDWVTYGHLFTGIAHAHLGNFGAAREHLLAVLPTESSVAAAEPAAEAAYWAALTWREEGDSQASAQYLQRALSLSPQPRFQAALNDAEARIRLTRAELIARRTDPWDVATEPTLAQVQQQEMSTKRGSLLDEGLAELGAMIGMDHVKDDVSAHCDYIRGLQRRAELGLPAARSSTHLVFAGPPGTGKTTVAKIIAKVYAGLGIIETDKLVTVGRGDLIGEYQGWTTPKVKAKLEQALDGVLFLDEAYSLVMDTGDGGSKDTFGSEAATELVAFMEENRDRLVVIIAGYSDDIDRLLDTNEGWSSRFTSRFDFCSYGIDDLVAMAQSWCEKEKYILPDESVGFIRSQAAGLNSTHVATGRKVIDRLGNGRFIRNLMESAAKYALGAAMNHSMASEVDKAAVSTLTVDAVERAFTLLQRRELGGV